MSEDELNDAYYTLDLENNPASIFFMEGDEA